MRRNESIAVEVKRLDLADGWTATVALGAGVFASGPAAARRLPALDDWQALLERFTSDPQRVPGYEVLKYSEKGEVFRGRLTWSGGALEVVCKRFNARGWGRRLLAAWRPSKVRVNFDRGVALLGAGIATAAPLAVLERRAPRREAWLITEFVPDAVDLDQVALVLIPRLEAERRRRVKKTIITAIVDLLERMERHELGHRDLKASNILLSNWDGQKEPLRLWLVDLEGLRPGRASSARRRRQPLVRLAVSLLGYDALTRPDCCRFVQSYLARAGTNHREWKPFFRELADAAADYARRSHRRKTNKLDAFVGES